MANTLVSTGELANLLARGTTVAIPAMESLRPVEALFDGDPALPGRFAALGSTPRVDTDVDLLKGTGGFEGTFSGINPVGFIGTIVGTGTITRETGGGLFTAGVASVALGVPANGDLARVTALVAVRAGERIRVRWKGRLSGSPPLNAALHLFVRNRFTGRYLHPDFTWQTSAPATGTMFQIGTTFPPLNGTKIDFAVESLVACGAPTTILEVFVQTAGVAGGAYTGYVDELEVLPGTSLVAAFGHNVDPLNPFQVTSADSADFLTNTTVLVAGAFPYQPTFYAKWSEAFFRYYTLRPISTTNTSESGPIWYGEFGLYHPLALSKGASFPIRIGERTPQVRNANAAGGVYVSPQGRPLRSIVLPYSLRADAQYVEMRDEIIRRSGQGQHPTLIVPLDTEPDVILARTAEATALDRRWLSVWEGPIELEEMALAELSA